MLVAPFHALPAEATAIAGGKGASLTRMTAAGLAVPPGFVVCADAFARFLDRTGAVPFIDDLLARLDVHDDAALERAAVSARRIITAGAVPDEIADAVGTSYQDLGSGTGDASVAVRSSAVAEDGDTASFAGQQETYLDVRGAENVLRHTKDCWASFFSPRALFYRAQKGTLGDTRMAVVVQEMVHADKSGVMFTVDPIRKRRTCMVVEAVRGLGEALVSGTVTPDHYVLNRDDGSVAEEFIEEESTRILSHSELRDLQAAGLRLESLFGRPQDVEWCIRAGDLFLLQSRPITTL
jgi:pyruvate,water dikinase